MREHLSPALEDYLKTIFRIEAEKKVVRGRDLSRALAVHKSTVTAALRTLSQKELIHYEPYEAVTLTKKGREQTRRLVRRHTVLQHFLEEILHVEPPLAASTACRMEHVIDEKVLDRLVCFLTFFNQNPKRKDTLLAEFHSFCSQGLDGRHPGALIGQFMKTLQTTASGKDGSAT